MKTSFTWNNVQYMFCGAPFGLKTLTSIFQRVITQLFYDLNYVITFVDDILIFSKTSEEHADHVKTVLQRLTEVNLTINTTKCKFGYEQIHVLGHYVSKNGIKLDREKAADAISWPQPKTGKDIQAFLGLANYFREFIPNFAFIAHPLDNLRNANEIESLWTNEHEDAFNLLKYSLCYPPILSYPDSNKHFYIATDASAFSIDAVIFQANDIEIQSVNFAKVKNYIKFASRVLSKSEQNYAASKREMLAIIFALKKFENYVLGRRFTILTDHMPLTFLLSQKKLGELQNTWLDILLRFNFQIAYLPGQLNTIPNLLSRLYPSNLLSKQQTEPMPTCAATSLTITQDHSDDALRKAIELGKTIPPEQDRERILQNYHSIAHEGASKLYLRCARDNLYWPELRRDCENISQSCLQCLRFSIQKQGYNPQVSLSGSLPMDHVAMDLIGPLPICEHGEKYILVLIDLFTRFIFLRAITNKTANEVAKALFEIFCMFGPRRVIQSDNGPEFANEVVSQLLILFNSEQRYTVPYHPQGNGAAERAVQSTLNQLRKLLNGKTDWISYLSLAQLQINLRIVSPTTSCPMELMFARKINTFGDTTENEFSEPSVEELQKRYELISQIVFPAIDSRSIHLQEESNKKWNAKHLLKKFPIDSFVMVRNNAPFNKLDLRYLGPYKVVEITKGGSYRLTDATGNILKRNFPPNLLKKSTLTQLTDSYYVERIVDFKTENGKELFRVRWFGYTPNEDTWEPTESFDDPALLHNFKIVQNLTAE